MFLPFSIKYSKSLQHKFVDSDKQKAMKYIRDFITQKSAMDISMEENRLVYRSSFFSIWSTNVFSTVEKGEFTFIEYGDETILAYEFYMYRLLISIIIICALATAASKEIWFVFLAWGCWE
jgi:hypothetical protein